MGQMKWIASSIASRGEGEQSCVCQTVVNLTPYSPRGCQTQEKIVAASAKTFVVIADYRYAHNNPYPYIISSYSLFCLHSKESTALGEKVLIVCCNAPIPSTN